MQLARIPAGTAPVIELALAGNRVLLKRYSDAAIAGGLAKRDWLESQEPWEAQWYDEDWQPLRSIAHREGIALGGTALRLATNGADGELAIESLDGAAPILVDHGCRFAEAFFLSGDEDPRLRVSWSGLPLRCGDGNANRARWRNGRRSSAAVRA